MGSNTPKIIEQLLKQCFHKKEFKEAYQEEKAEFIKRLEAEIGDELRTRINKIKGRLILLVGKSVKASEAAGRYAYCIKGHTILNFYSFSGKTDERIEDILNDSVYYDGNDTQRTGKLIECLASGGTVFLGNLKCHDRPLLERLAAGIRNVKYENYDKNMLIVSTTTSIDSVPEYFKELFGVEVIELEPEKQGKAEDIPQAKENVFYCSGGRWTIRYEAETIYPSNSLYLKYVKYLLENAYPKKFSYDELYLAITGSPELNTSKEQREETRNRFDEDMASQSTSGEMLDADYVKELKKRVNNLKKEMEDAKELGNDEKAAELQGEIDTIQKQGLTYVKKDGKSFKFIDHKQKSKKDTIMKGVKRCIKKIKKESLKGDCKNLLIWKHMNESIKLEGGNVFYMPKIPTTWN